MATAVALPVTVVLALVVNHAALRDSGDGAAAATPSASASPSGTSGSAAPLPPVDLASPPKTAAADKYCPGFIAALPITLDGLPARPAHADSPYVGAWGDPAVTFRCGVPKPPQLTPTSELVEVNGVRWLQVESGATTVVVAVDRPVYVELSVPATYAGEPITAITPAVAKTMPAQPVIGN